MATITTTIKEPKTFQQIQDEQTQLGKEKTLEDLNNNIAKLIQTINKKSEKELTADEKKIKANQLELSKLQLQRAQLGLANDQKHYSDYSQKYSKTHGVGSSIGVDQNTRDNTTAIALSAVTGGMLNPVVVKQVLLPPLKLMTNAVGGIVKALAPSRRISGKSSSAVDSDKDRKLHGKLDQIIGAIKEKTKPSSKKEGKEKSLLSRVVDSLLGLLKGVGKIALGMVAATILAKLGEKIGPTLEKVIGKVIGREASRDVVKLLGEIGPEMIAGYMIGGWRGALLGGGLKLAWDAWNELFPKETDVEAPPKISYTVRTINEYLPDFLKFDNDAHFKVAVAGLMLGGLKGAAAGWAIGKYSATIKKWVGNSPSNSDSEKNTEDKEENEKTWLTTLAGTLGLSTPEAVLPVLAGFYLKGIHGAVFGYLSGQILSEVALAEKYREAIKRGDEIEVQKIKEEMDDTKYRATLGGALAGFMKGGVSGAIIGGMLSFFTADIAAAYDLSRTWSGAFGEMLDSNIFGIPSSVWIGTLSLTALAIKSKLGWQGILAGAVLGAIGGFVADRYRSKELIEDLGYEAEWSGLGYKIKNEQGLELDIGELRQQARENLQKRGVMYTDKDVQNEVKQILIEKGVKTTNDYANETIEKAKEHVYKEIPRQVLGISDSDPDSFAKDFEYSVEYADIEDRVIDKLEKANLIETSGWGLWKKRKIKNEEDFKNKFGKLNDKERDAIKRMVEGSIESDDLVSQSYVIEAADKIINKEKEAQIQQDKKEQKEQQIENNKLNERTAVAAEKLVEMMEEEKKEKKEVFDTSSSDSPNNGYSDVLATGSFDSQLTALVK